MKAQCFKRTPRGGLQNDAPTVRVEVELNYHLGRSKAYELSCVVKVQEWDLRAF
jgi:hypothetical protein